MGMQHETGEPKVGAWYRDPLERRFEVVAIDEESGVIEVRYQDDECAQMDVADWRHVMVDHDALPEDPPASTEDVER